ncbi:hypothetical protein DB35_13360 [Streptomyces abyssalis]|uniref:Uncharacterized protein n=1 Tax=Streptomyces abyssalis TaxID=933944 RepID=A0A1E7JGR0_9ACTN|nr:nucleotide disphospho-sugar-binding domain-containing protein [Streptomyces abyssalis]OEU85649.1 hypothetical protein AN215_24625 [Streptomyces abyssalis]OEU92887.1 hypothetical protein DB35_13360 [Streptomyces abyssalis]OEV30513.1 hypothetical protein AN219_10435 [Streptomyces nanshensis]
MRVLFVGGGSPATIFGIVPLASAVRNAGHEVFMAGNEAMVPYITGAGLPALSVADHEIKHYMAREWDDRFDTENHQDMMGFIGSWFARLGADGFASLRKVVETWRPDLLVGGTMSYAAALLSAELKVPYVVQAWGLDEWTGTDAAAERVLAPELRELGLDRLPEPDLRIGICPPSIASPDSRDDLLMRWMPGNLQGRLEPWMYSRAERPRVCLTAGSRADHERGFKFLKTLSERIAPLDVDIVIPAPEELAAELRAAIPGVRTGWIPLNVVMPTCDLVVHHAGGATTMTALTSCVPQLVIPETPVFMPPVQRLADFGAGLAIPEAEATDSAVAEACRAILSDGDFTVRARALAAEIAELPSPAALLPRLERLADASLVPADA